jgi:hypothetical protein
MNKVGYTESAILKPNGFKNIAGGVLVQHGTGDDNVHFQSMYIGPFHSFPLTSTQTPR